MRSFQGKNFNYLPSASFSLWREFKPAQDRLHSHCEMKRGYSRYRKKEEKVKALLERDTSAQFIGKLAQQVVWEFHQNLHLLTEEIAINKIVELLDIEQQSEEIRERIYNVIRNYQQYPFLLGKSQLYIQERIQRIKKEPNHLLIQWGQYKFNLYFEMDCHFLESENTVHILDFKTGNSSPDKRQAYVYLLAAQSLFPDHSAIASFYNLETQEWSEPIQASSEYLECVLIELVLLSKKCTEERQLYSRHPEYFAKLFPPNPGKKCNYCTFQSICSYSEN
jgi:hypothetical protein